MSKASASTATDTPEEATTSFGFRTVPEQEKQAHVRGVFDSVAGRYDVMNDLMSGGMHRLWKDRFVGVLAPTPGRHYLDVAGGTGDIAFRIQDAIGSYGARHAKPLEHSAITISDINEAMLREGWSRAANQGRLTRHDLPPLEFATANAETLPFADNCMDGYTIAFGIRNVTHIDRALAEAHRVLKPGGRFLCLEFSPAVKAPLQKLYDAYSFNIIPRVGKLVTGDAEAYHYLVESIRRFPAPSRFTAMIEQAGFVRVRATPLSFGAVCIHSGWKL